MTTPARNPDASADDRTWSRSLEVAGLWGIAVTQPLLDLLGGAPQFFVASGISGAGIVAFAVLVGLVPAGVLSLVDLAAWRLGPRVGRTTHTTLIALLGVAVVLSVLRRIDLTPDVLSWSVALAGGALIAFAERSVRPFATGLRYLVAAPLVFVALFLLGSPTSQLVLEGEATAEDELRIERPAPIVILQLDELPLASLLRSDGTINEIRYPNFARLAAKTTWYPNAFAPASSTVLSLPATVSGTEPDADLLPTSSDYPRTVFTLLGDGYEQRVSESVTQLCPSTVCTTSGTGPAVHGGGLSGALSDATVVLGHVLLPRGARGHLPAVDDAWTGFAGDAASTDDAAKVTGETDHPLAVRLREVRDRFDADIADLEHLTDRTLWFTHVLLPHSPWLLGSRGSTYPPAGPNPRGRPDDRLWKREIGVQQGFQRHSLQLTYVDAQLGRILDELEGEGTWDDALVAVIADHGVSFRITTKYREPVLDTVNELYNIPFFLKLPGETGGSVNQSYVSTVDLLPTVVDALGIETDWEFDGDSLVDGRTGRAPVISPLGITRPPEGIPVSFQQTLDVARRNEDWLYRDDGVRGIIAVGAIGDFVGQPVDSVPVDGEMPWTWEMTPDLRAVGPGTDEPDLRPLVIDGTFAPGSAIPARQEALVVLNGVVAGVAQVYELTDSGEARFTAVLDRDAFSEDGRNTVEILAAADPVFRRVPPREP